MRHLQPDGTYFEEIHPDVWLMDDHKWAYYVWEKYRFEGKEIPSTLVHVDYHWDGIDDFQHHPESQTYLLAISDLPQIYELVSADLLVRYDSFIAAGVRRGLIREVHFYCLQTDPEIGLDESLLTQFEARQHVHDNVTSLVEAVSQIPVIFDFDLDLFDRSPKEGEGDLWAEEEILSFIDCVAGIVQSAPLMTIAMSFWQSGSEEDTRYLTHLAVPRLLQHFQT